jgi:hypothetical protein
VKPLSDEKILDLVELVVANDSLNLDHGKSPGFQFSARENCPQPPEF